jgi:hypothetical protein
MLPTGMNLHSARPLVPVGDIRTSPNPYRLRGWDVLSIKIPAYSGHIIYDFLPASTTDNDKKSRDYFVGSFGSYL